MVDTVGAQPQREPSFTERKAAQLRQERGVRERQEEQAHLMDLT